MTSWKRIKEYQGLVLIFILFSSIGLTQANTEYCDLQGIFANIIYVNQNAHGANNGSSWQAAFVKLPDALKLAAENGEEDQIWVSAGEYVAGDGISQSFLLSSNVSIVGGFAGFESNPQERILEKNKTILTGSDTQRVLFASEVHNVQLNDLVVQNGSANGDLRKNSLTQDNEVYGGGLMSVGSDLVICNVEFNDNRAKVFGGGIYVEGGSLILVRTVIKNNTVLRGKNEIHDQLEEADTDGGGLAIHDADLIVEDSLFEYNIAGDDGAAISARRVNVQIVGSRFNANKGIAAVLPLSNAVITDDFLTSMGGALSIQNEYVGQNNGDQSKLVTISHTTFSGNKSAIGSAGFIFNPPGSRVVIEYTKCLENGGPGIPISSGPDNELGIAFGKGAGAFLIVGTRAGDREIDETGTFVRSINEVSITHSLFADNEAGYGGALVLIGNNATINHVKFFRNTGRQRGGAIWNQNFFSLFDQFAGLEPVFGEAAILNSEFKSNETLGILETLQADSFPGVITNDEQTFGGGAISNDQGGILSVHNSQFINNVSINSDGGAIHNATSPVTAYGDIGAAAFYPGQLYISDSTFVGNQVTGKGSGGAIANGGNGLNGSILDAKGQERRDDVQVGSTLRVVNSLFVFNDAPDYGGALMNWNGSSLNLERSVVVFNSAYVGGGLAAIGRDSNLSDVKLMHSVISANVAGSGDGDDIYTENVAIN